jgi:hypothetical protein
VELVKFSELEDKIKGLIEGYSLLKEKNQQLEELLRQKEGALLEADGEIRRLHEEKDAVRAKVDSLLGIMQDIGFPK